MRPERGFSLIELLVVVIIIGVIAAIAISNLSQTKGAANEASAISSIRNLMTSQYTYATTKGGGKYASDLSVLESAGLIDAVLGGGNKDGYSFGVVSTGGAVMFTATANPVSPGFSGNRYFFVDESGVIRFSTSGTASSSNSPLQ